MVEAMILIVVVALIVWVLTTLLPLPEPFGKLIAVLGVIACIIILLRLAGHPLH